MCPKVKVFNTADVHEQRTKSKMQMMGVALYTFRHGSEHGIDMERKNMYAYMIKVFVGSTLFQMT